MFRLENTRLRSMFTVAVTKGWWLRKWNLPMRASAGAFNRRIGLQPMLAGNPATATCDWPGSEVMSYQLRPDQTLGANLRRICRKQVENALAIARGEKDSDDTPVHQTRKHLKKARAALQIVADEIGRPYFRKQD